MADEESRKSKTNLPAAGGAGAGGTGRRKSDDTVTGKRKADATGAGKRKADQTLSEMTAARQAEEALAESRAHQEMPQPSDTFNRGLRAISKDARPEDFEDLQGLYSIMYMERKAERFFKRDPNAPPSPDDTMTAGNKQYDKTEGYVFPFRGKEQEKLAEVTKSSPKAFMTAAALYKELSRHIFVPHLLKQLVGNEIHYYDPIDIDRDKNAREGLIKSENHTYGFTQVSINAVKLYILEFPILRQFLDRKNYMASDREIRALLDPECAPMIAAAVCEHHLKLWKDQNNEDGVPIPINAKSLAYGYNPDVYDVNGTLETSPVPIYGARKILMPSERVLAVSKHVKKVFERDY